MASLLPALRRNSTQEGQPLARLRDEIDTLFDRLLTPWSAPSEMESDLGSLLEVDIDERDDEFVVRAETPGFGPDEINVETSGRLLTIKAEKQEKKKGKKGNGAVEQETYRSFFRSITLPDGVQRDKIEAKYRNGLLEVHIPKSDEAKPKRIAVQK
jgi:HSP20 family protein